MRKPQASLPRKPDAQNPRYPVPLLSRLLHLRCLSSLHRPHGLTLPLLCRSTSANGWQRCRAKHTVTDKTTAPHGAVGLVVLRAHDVTVVRVLPSHRQVCASKAGYVRVDSPARARNNTVDQTGAVRAAIAAHGTASNTCSPGSCGPDPQVFTRTGTGQSLRWRKLPAGHARYTGPM